MHVYRIQRRQTLPISKEAAWPFFSTPLNLNDMTPPFLRFRITSVLPETIFDGLIITYRIAAVAGVPMTWVTEIKHVVPEFQFVDEQRVGPFRFWHHLHRFHSVPEGIEMEDVVHYVMPMGPLGRGVHALGIGARLRAIFDFRAAYLANLFGGLDPSPRGAGLR